MTEYVKRVRKMADDSLTSPDTKSPGPSVRDIFSRSIMLYGEEGLEKLQSSFVAVVGLGGVGSCAAESLARAGVGRLRIIDCDVVKPSDINRQILALYSNVGVPKVEAMAERLRAINPFIMVDPRHAFFHHETAEDLITDDIVYVIDAIDSLNPKGELIRWCSERSVPVISALGAAARTDPRQVRIGPLDDTVICPLARALRRHLRSKRISTDVPVIYSTERPVKPAGKDEPVLEASGTYIRGRLRKALPSISTIPAMFGIMAASHVIFSLLSGLPLRD